LQPSSRSGKRTGAPPHVARMVAKQRLSEEERFAALHLQFPKAPRQELLRFCRARPKSVEEAANMFEDHQEWCKGPGSAQKLEDAEKIVGTGYVTRCGAARDGTPILHVQGARYDPSIEPENYVLACAKAIQDARGPDDEGKVTVLVDVRPGEGWANVPAHKMLPFFKLACALLPNHFPERAHRIIVYPMPMLVKTLWRGVRSLLDPVTQEKFVILGGSANIGSPCPAELAEYVLLDQLPEELHHTHRALAQN